MVDFLFICCRLPLAAFGTFAILLGGAVLFLLETPLAVICFPMCAAFTSRGWLRSHWPGTYPSSLIWLFSTADGIEEYEPRGGFGLIQDMWKWVFEIEDDYEEESKEVDEDDD